MAEGGVDSAPPDPKPEDASTPASKVQFLESPEGRRLAYRKLEGSSPGVVYIHGLNSTMNGEKAQALEQACRRQGNGFLRFDLSGHGQSSQDFSECNITMWLEDITSVISSLTVGPQVLVGSSLGGWLMFLYTMRNPDNIAGLIGVCVAPDFTQTLWRNLSKEEKQEVRRTGVYRQSSPYVEPYDVTLQLIQDGDKYSIMDMPGEGRERERESIVYYFPQGGGHSYYNTGCYDFYMILSTMDPTEHAQYSQAVCVVSIPPHRCKRGLVLGWRSQGKELGPL